MLCGGEEAKMICPKCKSENQFGNFCSECGNQLKEKCPECGKMEPIGRKICKTRLGKAKKIQKKYLQKNVGEWREQLGRTWGFLFIPTVAICLIVIKTGIPFSTPFSLTWSWKIIMFTIVAIYILGFPILSWSEKKQKQAEKNAQQEFLRENPKYAEILRKAEEE